MNQKKVISTSCALAFAVCLPLTAGAQGGGVPALQARVTTLEAAVATLQAQLAALGSLTVSGAINPDGTSQLANSQFTSSRLGVGSYRLDFPAGVFSSLPAIVVMPIGRAVILGVFESPLGGGAFRIDYFTAGIDSNLLEDTLVNFIATPFSQD